MTKSDSNHTRSDSILPSLVAEIAPRALCNAWNASFRRIDCTKISKKHHFKSNSLIMPISIYAPLTQSIACKTFPDIYKSQEGFRDEQQDHTWNFLTSIKSNAFIGGVNWFYCCCCFLVIILVCMSLLLLLLPCFSSVLFNPSKLQFLDILFVFQDGFLGSKYVRVCILVRKFWILNALVYILLLSNVLQSYLFIIIKAEIYR